MDERKKKSNLGFNWRKGLQCETVVFLNGTRTQRQKTREVSLFLLPRRTEAARISSRSQAWGVALGGRGISQTNEILMMWPNPSCFATLLHYVLHHLRLSALLSQCCSVQLMQPGNNTFCLVLGCRRWRWGWKEAPLRSPESVLALTTYILVFSPSWGEVLRAALMAMLPFLFNHGALSTYRRVSDIHRKFARTGRDHGGDGVAVQWSCHIVAFFCFSGPIKLAVWALTLCLLLASVPFVPMILE